MCVMLIGALSLGIRTHLFSLAFCYRTTRYIYFIEAVISQSQPFSVSPSLASSTLLLRFIHSFANPPACLRIMKGIMSHVRDEALLERSTSCIKIRWTFH